jgi:Tfp pilus assembly protein PilN
MIKINLLESVTDQPSGVAMVEDKMANPRMQTLLLALTVSGLLVLGAGYDYVSSKSAHEAAQHEVESQRHINQQMLAVNREQAELEKKTQDIQGRIDAIKKLRESQQGPGSVLREIKARFDGVPGLYLKSIEQKDGELTIKGESPNESSVTRFGQSMEFSSGLFTNLNIETQRELAKVTATTVSDPTPVDPDAPKPEVVSFTVKCNYATTKPQSQPAANSTSNQVAMKK